MQIAKSLGAEVTAVCSTRNVDLVRSIGADHVIDYTKEDFTKSDQRYDVIFDNVANHSFTERRRVLNPKGICVLAGMGGAGVKEGQALGRIAGNLFTARGLSSFTDQKFAQYMTKVSKDDLIMLGDLVETGKLRPVIERTYKLTDAPEALRYLNEGHAKGKIIITVELTRKEGDMNPVWKKNRIATAVYLAPLLVAGQLSGSTLQEQNKAIAKQAFEEILSRGRFELAEKIFMRRISLRSRHSFQRHLRGRPDSTERLACCISGCCHHA